MLRQALALVTNIIGNIETVKYFNGEQFEQQCYSKAIARSGKAYKKQANIRGMQLGITQFFTQSIFVQGFWYGSYLVMKGNKDPGQVLTTFWAALMAVNAVTGFLPQFIILQKGKVAGARLRASVSRMKSDGSETEGKGDIRPERVFGNVEFRQVNTPCSSMCGKLTYSGTILLPVTIESSCSTPGITVFPGRPNHLRHWKERIWKKHARPASGQVLPANFRSDLSGRRPDPRSGCQMAP